MLWTVAVLESLSKENTMSESFPAPAPGNTVPVPDPIAFEAEMSPHLDSLYRNALRLTGNSNDAEDLVQDTYVRAFRFFHQYELGTNAKAWLFRIMNTIFLNDYRKKSRQGESLSYDGMEDFYLYNRINETSISPSQTMTTANPEEVVLERLDIEEIQAAIEQLPEEFRDTVALATLEGLAYQEISDILQIPIGTVRSRLSRGRKLLQRSLWKTLTGDDRPPASLTAPEPLPA
jgi:RNA polymerase sigma-70 factor (ECF subfamily)